MRAAGEPPSATRGAPLALVAPEVAEAQDAGPVDPSTPLEKMALVFPVRDPAGLEAFLGALQDPASPHFRRWLTPAQFGERFGAPVRDLQAVASWLKDEGFAVEGASAGRTALVFSGRAADVERAFDTEIRLFVRNGEAAIGNARPLTLPPRLQGVPVRGLLPVSGFSRRTPYVRAAEPLYNSGSGTGLGPADFATIYGLDGVYTTWRGAGQSIAIPAKTQIRLDDTRTFRSFFGLPARDPIVVPNGPDPGFSPGSIDSIETNLDVQWSGGIAPDADVFIVVSRSTTTTDGTDLSELYAVDQNLAGILSLSYGTCEQLLSPAEVAFFTNLWAQAAAQGISVLVAAGDSGAAGCDPYSASTGSRAAVNGLGSSPYVTCVGGTEFDDGGDPSLYWSDTNDPVTMRSAKGPIPQSVWNDSGAAGGSGLLGTGGGASVLYARPTWQSVPGTPAGSQRLVPDVSVAAGRSVRYYLFEQVFGSFPVYGTSASAPAFAGLAALLAQASGGRVGSLNPGLYALGARQYAGGPLPVFHDVTTGNNSVPGVTGYSAGPGYDAASGLGTPDGAALAATFPAAVTPALGGDFALLASPAVVTLTPGGAAIVRLGISRAGAADLAATVSLDPLPAGLSASFAPTSASSPAAVVGYVSAGIPGSLTLTADPGMPEESFTLNVSGTAGGVTRRVSLFVTVGGAPLVVPGAEVQVPVVLNVPGVGGSRFSSDLVVLNRSGADTTLLLRYVAAPGTPGSGGPVVGRSLGAGRQFYTSDAIGFLAANGYDFSGGDPKGTLFVTFAGVSDATLVFSGSRTSTPNPDAAVGGSFGTFSAAVPRGEATADETWVYGLREDTAYRSNLALVDAETADSGAPDPLSLEVQLFDGDTGQAAGPPIAETLQPGEFLQLNGVLTKAPGGVSNGYARIRRTSGGALFIAYGVVNDGGSAGGGTSDGSLVVSGGSDGLVPIVLDLPGAVHYQTEMTLTNPTAAPVRATLTYTPAATWGTAGGGSVGVNLAAGQQLRVPNVLDALRQAGLSIPPGPQGGTLLVSGAVAEARTFNPNPNVAVGGTFGLSYPAWPAGARASAEAIVCGLRQDGGVRANLAVSDARTAGAPIDYVVEVWDGAAGGTSPAATFVRSLGPGGWVQINGVLAQSGVTSGWVRVRTSAGVSDFVTYGVLNDGAAPGVGTSDGSFVPMIVVN